MDRDRLFWCLFFLNCLLATKGWLFVLNVQDNTPGTTYDRDKLIVSSINISENVLNRRVSYII